MRTFYTLMECISESGVLHRGNVSFTCSDTPLPFSALEQKKVEWCKMLNDNGHICKPEKTIVTQFWVIP